MAGKTKTKSKDSTADKRRSKAAIREENEALILRAAEEIFAEKGFGGATTAQIAEYANVPKANLHYYFPKKADLYRRVIEDICNAWLDARNAFDIHDDPAAAIGGYIRVKMELSRSRPHGSKIWASEVISGAGEVQEYIQTAVKEWLQDMERQFKIWQDEGRIAQVTPRTFLFMVWATTQHYADFESQINLLNGGEPLDSEEYKKTTEEVVGLMLRSLNIK